MPYTRFCNCLLDYDLRFTHCWYGFLFASSPLCSNEKTKSVGLTSHPKSRDCHPLCTDCYAHIWVKLTTAHKVMIRFGQKVIAEKPLSKPWFHSSLDQVS